jgi:hypothetical protein
VSRTTTKIA